ncbi:MAG: DNA polymerase III subunit delta [Longimicrobiales bacterium]
MSAARADALSKALAKGTRGGIWLLHGAEDWLKEEAVHALIDAHLDPATRDFNLDQLRASSLDPEALASICQTPPMMADWRVVIVRDASALAANAKLRTLVENLISKHVPGLVLVFVAGETSNAKFWNDFKKATRAIEYRPLSSSDVPAWLIERAQQSGVEMDPSAARALASAIGAELGVLSQELAKLIDFAGDSRRVDVADVRAIVGHVPRVNRWDWFDTVGETRFAHARAALAVLLDSDSGVGLIIGLGSHLLRIGVVIDGGERALASAVGGPPWILKRFTGQARNWTQSMLDDALDDLLRADRLLKSTSLDQHQVLDELMLRFEARRTAAAA